MVLSARVFQLRPADLAPFLILRKVKCSNHFSYLARHTKED